MSTIQTVAYTVDEACLAQYHGPKGTPMTAKARKAATGPQPDARLPNGPEDDVGDGSALEAIRSGKDTVPILVEYLRFSEDISPNVLSALVAMLNPGSDHPWRLHLKCRHRGKPQKTGKYKPDLINSTLERISRKPMSVETARELAEMLDPESRHQFRLSLRKRKRGPVPRSPWLSPIPMDKEFLIRKALKRTGKLEAIVRELQDQGISRKMFFDFKKRNEQQNKSAQRPDRVRAAAKRKRF